MKSICTAVIFIATAFAQAKTPAEESLDRLKALAGSWTGKNSAGTPLEVSFRQTSGGSALESEVHAGGKNPEDMVSMIHLDGNRLVLTHYCSAGNQPRMAGNASPDGRTITFDFFDATNLADPNDGHMWRVIISMLDADHHLETWIYLDHGKKMTEVYDLRRAERRP
jgi:hypothetical protein